VRIIIEFSRGWPGIIRAKKEKENGELIIGLATERAGTRSLSVPAAGEKRKHMQIVGFSRQWQQYKKKY